MVYVYGEDCVSGKSVRKWSARFRACRESLFDDPRPGQATHVITANPLIDTVDDLVRSDRCVTLRMLVVKVDVSVGTVCTIVYDRLRYRKVCAHWVPKQLADQHKELRMHFNICFGIMKIQLSWSGSSEVIKAGAITTSQRQRGTACRGSIRSHLP
ncbi:Protein GVQW3 like protein [Argiope bruennichi]|uniref:Protein GVQW3 like protein n=1 Tax=Argiope bruennichi TaxID=94029 RepID=A0A8T0F800_ARGBR|nr:Protein GVQW3 like protein [Argiope bruennichi]